jgi:nucleotide-binding universal stress UspA family protein
VICLGVEYVPREASTWLPGPVMSDRGRDQAHEGTQLLTAWVRSVLPGALSARVLPLAAPSLSLTAVAARAVRLNDLLVATRPYGAGHGPLAPLLAEALLFGTGAPVLVVPDRDRTDWSRSFRRICLSWNDSDEVLRAARAALPFLRAAECVTIVIIDPGHPPWDPQDLGDEVALWLSRHGVVAEVTILKRSEPNEAEILARVALQSGCEAMVLGAYGHSRLREAMLGGVTRDLLTRVPLPLLMAH